MGFYETMESGPRLSRTITRQSRECGHLHECEGSRECGRLRECRVSFHPIESLSALAVVEGAFCETLHALSVVHEKRESGYGCCYFNINTRALVMEAPPATHIALCDDAITLPPTKIAEFRNSDRLPWSRCFGHVALVTLTWGCAHGDENPIAREVPADHGIRRPAALVALRNYRRSNPSRWWRCSGCRCGLRECRACRSARP